MKLLVIGATGPTGCLIAQQATQAGHSVTCLVRRPEAGKDLGAASLMQGDVLDPASLAGATLGQGAVISSLGSAISLLRPVTLLSEGTRNLITAMKRTGVRRLVCITGIGAGDSRGHGGFLYDRLIRPTILRQVYEDKDRQEAEVRASGLDWVIVRPGLLTDGPARGRYQARTDLAGYSAGKISRADVAAFALEQVTENTYLGRAPVLSD